METQTIALFGEAEKGEYRIPHFCESMTQLFERVGLPPPESRGIYYAIQALLYDYRLIFFRVREEGFSYPDYLQGLQLLQQHRIASHLAAICMPGVGDAEIIEAIVPLCAHYHSILIIDDADLYDYLTEVNLR